MKTKNKSIGHFILITIGVLGLLLLVLLNPIKQSQTYHNFSDNITIFNVPNFWNVASNVPFLFVGLLGILKLDTITKNKLPYFIGLKIS